MDAWIFSKNPSGAEAPPIVKKANTASGYALELSVDSSQVIFWVYRGAGGWSSSPAGGLTRGIWTHVAGVYDGTSVTLHMNGQLIGSKEAPGSILPSNSSLNIGWDSSTPYRFFNGLIDEVEIFSRALAESEIAAIYNAGYAGKCPLYAITANATGNGSGTVQSDAGGINYPYPGTVTGTTSYLDPGSSVILTATATAGSTADWTTCTGTAAGNGTATATCIYASLDGNKTAEAAFTLNTYTVTANAAGNGAGTVQSNVGGVNYNYPATNTGTTSAMNYGTNVVLTATASTGSTVAWTTCTGKASGQGTGLATCSYSSLDGTKTAVATFTLNTYTVTANAQGNGTGTVQSNIGGLNYNYPGTATGTTGAIDHGTGLTLTATASAESKATWTTCTGTASGNSTAQATCTYAGLDGNKTAEVTFSMKEALYLPLILKN